jgi:hypothetical protein
MFSVTQQAGYRISGLELRINCFITQFCPERWVDIDFKFVDLGDVSIS